MNHSITVAGLLLALGIMGGLGAAAFGTLMVMAGGMSDAPAAGDAAGKQGCIVGSIGMIVLVACILGMVL